jgi:hypothetical protein
MVGGASVGRGMSRGGKSTGIRCNTDKSDGTIRGAAATSTAVGPSFGRAKKLIRPARGVAPAA